MTPHPPAVPPPAYIIVIRHAEKPADPNDPHLSPAGVKRAKQLVSFITNDPAMVKLGVPVAVFATKTTEDKDGQRSQETVAPLARALKLPVQTPYIAKDYAELPKEILENPAYAGKTVLNCWNHEEITDLESALGVKKEPSKWKGSVFDRVDIIAYHDGKATLTTSRYGGK
jgi:broad specificity phosphatase PhoE